MYEVANREQQENSDVEKEAQLLLSTWPAHDPFKETDIDQQNAIINFFVAHKEKISPSLISKLITMASDAGFHSVFFKDFISYADSESLTMSVEEKLRDEGYASVIEGNESKFAPAPERSTKT